MAGYLVVSVADPLTSFKLHTNVMPPTMVDELETLQAGWLDKQLELWSRFIDARLKKRVVVPFVAPVPDAVKSWLARIVTLRAFLRLGIDALDSQMVVVQQDAEMAMSELKEASDGEASLFDLPLIEGGGSGFNEPRTRSYSEQSPFVQRDRQRSVGRNEDRDGIGTEK